MSKHGGNLLAELAKIRKQQANAISATHAGEREREEKIKKLNAKKPGPKGPRKPKASAAQTSSGAVEASSGDWKTQLAQPSQPLGMRQKQVVDYLRNLEQPASIEQIKAAIQIDINTQADLQQALENNIKVGIDDEGCFFYRPDANIKDKAQLLEFVRKAAAPVALPEIQDAYKTVLNDVKSLKDEGLIVGLWSYDPELQTEILYAVDTKLQGMKVDDDVNALWHQIEVPEEDESLKAELVKHGLKPAPRKAPRKAVNANKEKRKRQRKQQRLRTVTNVHLMHLFEGAEMPTTIDE